MRSEVDVLRDCYVHAERALREAQLAYPADVESGLQTGAFPAASSWLEVYIDPAVEWQALWSPTPYRGHSGVARYVREFMDFMDDWHWESLEFRHSGEGVVGIFDVLVTGRGSGAAVRQRIAISYRLTNGRITHYREHLTVEEATTALQSPR
jgi:ketosteroid isomerase-like protein